MNARFEWILFDDELPPPNTEVLVTNGHERGLAQYDPDTWQWRGVAFQDVTHWAKVPSLEFSRSSEVLSQKQRTALFEHFAKSWGQEKGAFLLGVLIPSVEAYANEISNESRLPTGDDVQAAQDMARAAYELADFCAHVSGLEKWCNGLRVIESSIRTLAHELGAEIPGKKGRGRPLSIGPRYEFIRQVRDIYPKHTRGLKTLSEGKPNHFFDTLRMVIQWIEGTISDEMLQKNVNAALKK